MKRVCNSDKAQDEIQWLGLVNCELAVIIRGRAASRAGETTVTVTHICAQIVLAAAYIERLHYFKSDADWSAQIKHNFMCSADVAPMLLQLSMLLSNKYVFFFT